MLAVAAWRVKKCIETLMIFCCYAGQPRAVAAQVTAKTPFRLLGRDEDDDQHAVATGVSREMADAVSRRLAEAGTDVTTEKANAAAAAAAEAASEAVGGNLRKQPDTLVQTIFSKRILERPF